MRFLTWIIALILIVGVFSTHRSVRRSTSEAERFFSMRLALFSWLAGFAFVIALIFLPNKQRVLLMIPLFVGIVTEIEEKTEEVLRRLRNGERTSGRERFDIHRN